MDKSLDSLEFDLQINPDELDKEWMRQPLLFFRYACVLSDARQEYEVAKNNMEVVRAEIDQRVRTDPSAYGIKKLTEAAVSAVIPTLPEYKRVRKHLLDTKHKVDIYESVVGALEHRKKALEKLVELYLAGYFSEPKVRGELEGEELEDARKRLLRKGRMRSGM